MFIVHGIRVVLQGGYDVGYFYECQFHNDPHNEFAGEAVRTMAVEDLNDVPVTVITFWSVLFK